MHEVDGLELLAVGEVGAGEPVEKVDTAQSEGESLTLSHSLGAASTQSQDIGPQCLDHTRPLRRAVRLSLWLSRGLGPFAFGALRLWALGAMHAHALRKLGTLRAKGLANALESQ